MAANRLKEFLDSNHISYMTLVHPQVFTSQEVASSAHISGKKLAKTVMVKIDGRMAMAVLPASSHIDFIRFRDEINAGKIELAREDEFEDLFPECETGAMPPFGNLYGIDVIVAEQLCNDKEIAFNSGSHTELIKLAYDDFERLVHPRTAKFTC